MPEGHTVHRLAAAFRDQFVGKQVDASSPQGRFAEGAALLDGHVLGQAEAQGKQMFLGFSEHVWLRVHLGLYGMWRFAGEGLQGIGRRNRAAAGEAFPPEPRGLVRLRLVAGRHLADLSGPTACEVISPAEKALAMARLGEDPLRDDADPDRAYAKLNKSRMSIGLLLMRQDIVAGIGNIYRAEVLFRAGLSPFLAGREIQQDVWAALWTDLAALLADGVRQGRIVTVADAHRGGRNRRGGSTYVAHRAGEPCRVCGEAVLSEMMGGRRLYWCGHCQPHSTQ